MAVVIASIIQVFIGAGRPHAPKDGEKPEPKRRYWLIAHRLFAAFALFGGLINVILAPGEYFILSGGEKGSAEFPGSILVQNVTIEHVFYAMGAIPIIILVPLWMWAGGKRHKIEHMAITNTTAGAAAGTVPTARVADKA